ncbi:MAG: hypothetical protein LBK53_01955 [Heliobacteriaceae bacterium]|nr:hypothetical protein [Heliobacteriaceae bacterium]
MQVSSNVQNNGIQKITINLDSQNLLGTKKNVNMTKNGSVFNMVSTPRPQTNPANDPANDPKAGEGEGGGNSSPEVSTASATEAQGKLATLQAKTEADAQKTQTAGQNAKDLSSEINANQQSFLQLQSSKQADVDQKNKIIQKMNREMEKENAAMKSLEKDYEEALSKGDTAQLSYIQTQISGKTTIMDAYGRQVYTLSNANNKSINQMNKMSNQFINMQKVNQNAMKTEMSTAQKVGKVADQVDQIGQLTQSIGKALQMLGSAISGTGWGATVGAVMINIGLVTETAGQYGSAAAQVTKTVCYASEGNYMAALQSAASATMTGCSAIEGTKNMKANFDANNQKANQVLKEKETNKAFEKMVEDGGGKDTFKTQAEELGMSPKEYENAIKERMNGSGSLKLDSNGNRMKDSNGDYIVEYTADDEGNPVYEQAKDKDGKLLFNDDGTQMDAHEQETKEGKLQWDDDGKPIFKENSKKINKKDEKGNPIYNKKTLTKQQALIEIKNNIRSEYNNMVAKEMGDNVIYQDGQLYETKIENGRKKADTGKPILPGNEKFKAAKEKVAKANKQKTQTKSTGLKERGEEAAKIFNMGAGVLAAMNPQQQQQPANMTPNKNTYKKQYKHKKISWR